MNLPDRKAKVRRYSLLAMAAVLLVAGGIALYVGSINPALRPMGVGAVLFSVLLVRISNARGSSISRTDEVAVKPTDGPSRSLKLLSLALVPVAIASVLLLMNDAAHGAHEVLPVYIFAGVACICTVVWSYWVSQNTR